MGPEGIILVNPPITTFQQSLTHSAVGWGKIFRGGSDESSHQNGRNQKPRKQFRRSQHRRTFDKKKFKTNSLFIPDHVPAGRQKNGGYMGVA